MVGTFFPAHLDHVVQEIKSTSWKHTIVCGCGYLLEIAEVEVRFLDDFPKST